MADQSSPLHPTRDRALRAWMRLARLYGTTVDGISRHLRAFDLSPAEFDVLAQLAASEGGTQQELASRLLVTPGNVSYHMARLVRRGLVDRRSDGRCKRLSLTPAGRSLLAAALPVVATFHANQFAALTREEQHILAALLRKLDRHARASVASTFQD
jgi:DNA-binding MarR family transcriptional regulator